MIVFCNIRLEIISIADYLFEMKYSYYILLENFDINNWLVDQKLASFNRNRSMKKTLKENIINELKQIYNSFDEDIEIFDEENEGEFIKIFDFLKTKNLEIPSKSLASYIFFNAIFD